MKPTIAWMSQTFDEYNRKYFGGKLRLPNFSTRCSNQHWGYYMPDGTYNKVTRTFKPNGFGTLYLNGNYDREENDLIGTLLHEMIHMYINTVMLKYPLNPHGRYFTSFANRLNQDGWNIMESNEQKDSDKYDSENGNEKTSFKYRLPSPDDETYLICIINQPNDPNFSTWLFRAEQENLNDYINTAKKLKNINGAESMAIYHCYAQELGQMPADSATLPGIGARGYHSALYELNKKYGVILGKKNFRLLKEIPL